MKEIIRNVKVSDIPTVIRKLGWSENTRVHLTIESQDEATHALMDIVNDIRIHAKSQGLTDEKLEELLADES